MLPSNLDTRQAVVQGLLPFASKVSQHQTHRPNARLHSKTRHGHQLRTHQASSRTGEPENRVSLNGASLNGAGPSNGRASRLAPDAQVALDHSSNGASRNGASLNGAGSSQQTGASVAAADLNGAGRDSVNMLRGSPKREREIAADKRAQAVGQALEDAAVIEAQAAEWQDACDAGQLSSCAVDRSMDLDSQILQQKMEQQEAGKHVKTGRPYRAPGGRWSNFKKYSVFQRSLMIWSFALVLCFKLFWSNAKISYGRKGMTPERVKSRKLKVAAWVREGLIKLGPTFIKIGQQFSTRVDVLSPEFIGELEKLQDNVPAFDSTEAISIVERNLGAPVTQMYESFDAEPIAAASLGQVHLAQLNGQRVVVKVQRPGLKDLFDIDLKNVRVLAQWLQNLDPKSDGAARDWVAIYDECARILYQEIDYKLEGQSADRFRKNFGTAEWIKVPTVLWERTTSEVLTMEYCPGTKINRIEQLDAMGVDKQRLARLAVESYLQQILTHGFFHAASHSNDYEVSLTCVFVPSDPHPGNIAVDAVSGGRLIYYDFGMMGEIPSDIRAGLLELFYGVYEKDPDRCLDALITMGVLVPGGDRTAIRRTAEFFLTSFGERLKQQKEEAKSNPGYRDEFKPKMSKEDQKGKRKQILSSIGEDLLVASADKPFRFPATFTFVVRSFTVLDGIGKGLDPRFDISEISAPYARGLLLEGNPQYAALLKEFKKKAGTQNRAFKNLFRSPNYIEDVATTVKQLERGDLKLRVRALETERALNRVQLMQKVTTAALVASTLVNVGTVLSVSAMARASQASFVGAGVWGLQVLINWAKLKRLEKKEAQLTGA